MIDFGGVANVRARSPLPWYGTGSEVHMAVQLIGELAHGHAPLQAALLSPPDKIGTATRAQAAAPASSPSVQAEAGVLSALAEYAEALVSALPLAQRRGDQAVFVVASAVCSALERCLDAPSPHSQVSVC